MNEAKRVEVSLFGETYSVLSDESAERVSQIAQEVDSLMQLIARKTGLTDAKKIAALTALKLATNQFKLEDALTSNRQVVARLIALADQGLHF